ncbi:MAG: 4Fe-4S binding protein, partial [Rhodobacteraceae bacterium]|nr:4Fe-4S binding protein [Paracoccaceae bacterium]
MAKHLILCDCLGSQTIDAPALSAATGLTCSRIHTALCTRQIDAAEAAIKAGDAVILCAQERARFEEIADDLDVPAPIFVDIRDRAGWTEDKTAAPKMAALIAEALIERPATKAMDILSSGMCLVIGATDIALTAAERLKDTLTVTVLMTDTGELPLGRGYEVIRGRNLRASGTFGDFRIALDALEQVEPGGRGGFGMTKPRDGAETRCDIILDLTGGTPLFPAPEKRDGYLRADPGNAAAVAAAIFEAAQHVGTFEKPLHIALNDTLCAHSRAGQTGCTRCLDACPTGAITSAGDHVAVDPLICAGCGACSSLCPSGAISYDTPPVAHLLRRVRVLSETYLAAGGQTPRLLVHDLDHGSEMIALAARFGRGLPADTIPLGVDALASFGHSEILAAIATGFAAVDILLAPRSDRTVIVREVALAAAMGAGARVTVHDLADP